MSRLLVGLFLSLGACGSNSVATATNNADNAPAEPATAAPAPGDGAPALDLATLRTADRATVLRYGARRSVPDRSHAVSGPALTALLDAMVPGQQRIHGGILEGKITLYRGAALVREIWVDTNGDWGVTIDGTGWTQGTSAVLLTQLD